MLPIKRALGAIGGAGGVALSSLILALCLMQQAEARDYGIFAFLLVTQALANGISNALLGSPLLIVLGSKERDTQKIQSFMLANLLLCILFACAQGSIAWIMVGNLGITIAYFFSALLTTIRWFGRSYANNNHQHTKVVRSDGVYSLFTMAGALCLWLMNEVSLIAFGLLTASAALFAMVFLGKEFVNSQFRSVLSAKLGGFFEGVKRQGRYALVGVLATECTSNSHAYLITSILGPSAFAPIAAATLLFRPFMVVLTSLTQVERPRLRRLISEGLAAKAKSSLSRFLFINLFSWCVTAIAASIVIIFFIEQYWGEESSRSDLILGVMILMVVNLIRVFKNPLSVYFQAEDRFKVLSKITIISCLVTLPVAYVLLIYMGSVYSMLGVVVGELISVIMMFCKFLNKK